MAGDGQDRPLRPNVIRLGVDSLGARGPLKEPAPGHPAGFLAALQDVREQLLQLSGLVDVLAAQHELEVGKLAPNAISLKAAAHIDPESKGQDAGEEVRVGLRPSESAFLFSEEGFLKAVQNSDVVKVQEMLNQRANPNMPCEEFACQGLTFTTCTPLVLAIRNGHRGLVRLLMQAKADPQIEYSFPAGAEQITWSGPAIHACIPSGDLAMLQELIHLRADPHVSSSTGANLVWQAAYFGQEPVLQFLLELGVDFECKAMCQDDSTLHLSPLHAAAKSGNFSTTSALLDARASLLVDNGFGSEPLDDAVSNGHADVVQLLVARRADIFQTSPPPRGDGLGEGKDRLPSRKRIASMLTKSIQEKEKESCRRIDLVFSSNNHVLVAAVARGLRDMPRMPLLFTRADLIRFLYAPGDAGSEIWNAIFRRHDLKHWEAGSRTNKLVRVVTRAAYVDAEVGMNIVEGPSAAFLQAMFTAKRTLPEDCQRFNGKLASSTPRMSTDVFVPVHFYACQLPFIHEDLQVILALAYCKNDHILGLPGCRAIVEFKWSQERPGAQARMVMAFVEVVNLVMVNMILNNDFNPHDNWLTVANVLAFGVWVVVMIVEVAQIVGYHAHGLIGRYFFNARHTFDSVVLIMTGIIIVWTWLEGFLVVQSATYRIMLGFVVSLKWGRLLISLRQLKSVGLQILPILNTMLDVGPFLAVLSVYFIGAVQMLYALGNHTLEDAFLIIYRLVVLGDMSLTEMEGDGRLYLTQDPTGDIRQTPLPATEYRTVIEAMMIFVSFLMGISMMNLFVAMLCVSYSEAAERAPLAFVRSTAGIVLDQHAARKGLRRLCCCCRSRQRSFSLLLRRSKGTSSESITSKTEDWSMDQEPADLNHEYIWFSQPLHSH